MANFTGLSGDFMSIMTKCVNSNSHEGMARLVIAQHDAISKNKSTKNEQQTQSAGAAQGGGASAGNNNGMSDKRRNALERLKMYLDKN